MSQKRNEGLLVQMSLIVEAFARLVSEREHVEIYFHPGWDPDAEASIRLVCYAAMQYGATSVKIFHKGEPKLLVAIEDHMEVLPIEQGWLLSKEHDKPPVTVVVDVSNPRFLTGDAQALPKQADFLFDHHHPGGVELRYAADDEDLVVGGRLVLPQYGCTALLLDHLLLISQGGSNHLTQDSDLAALVWAALLTDQDLQRNDAKPDWLSPQIWNRLDDIRPIASESIVQKLVVEPWQDNAYVEMLGSAVQEEHLYLRSDAGVRSVFCWLGNLEKASRRPWVGHTAGLILAKRAAVSNHLPDDHVNLACTVAAFPDIGSHGAVMVSLRTDGSVNAGDMIRSLTNGLGGGRDTAAAAMLFKDGNGTSLEEFGRGKAVELSRFLPKCMRKFRPDQEDE